MKESRRLYSSRAMKGKGEWPVLASPQGEERREAASFTPRNDGPHFGVGDRGEEGRGRERVHRFSCGLSGGKTGSPFFVGEGRGRVLLGAGNCFGYRLLEEKKENFWSSREKGKKGGAPPSRILVHAVLSFIGGGGEKRASCRTPGGGNYALG